MFSVKKSKNPPQNPRISLLIPTWNNWAFIKNCLESLGKNSHFSHQIIVIVNEGADGTRDFFEKNETDFDVVFFEKNAGICLGLNAARCLVRAPILGYANDDMYFLPGWDKPLLAKIDAIPHEKWMISATMIEPTDTGNPCVLVANFGDSTENFDEKKLLEAAPHFSKKNWSGSTWPPVFVPTKIWDAVGGLSIEFSPGMYSDPDFSMKCWQIGVRHFEGIGSSLVYHFGSKSTKKVRKNDGKRRFLQKWGITAGFFSKKYLRRGKDFKGELPEIQIHFWEKIIQKMKRFW